MPTKTSLIDTNFNNKLGCPHFVRIDLAPDKKLSEMRLENVTFLIQTKDNSHPPVNAKLCDVLRVKLRDLRNCMTWPSHSMDAYTFKLSLLNQDKELSGETDMAVYFFERI